MVKCAMRVTFPTLYAEAGLSIKLCVVKSTATSTVLQSLIAISVWYNLNFVDIGNNMTNQLCA